MNWIGLYVQCPAELRDILLAELSQLPFDTFEETDEGLGAFCSTEDWQEENAKQILSQYNQKDYRIEEIEKVNWNQEWEKNYDPILIADRCQVRATFHDPSGLPYEIVINPKMSFGTGHHATTHLVLEYQLDLDHHGKKVMDVGCGTGVLAIMAKKRGASIIQAFDIEDWCVENSLENFALNNCSEIAVDQKEIRAVEDTDFDIILANITKGVHRDLINEYHIRMIQGGVLVLSGFFEDDVKEVVSFAEQSRFQFVETKSYNGWARLVCRKQ